MPSPNAQRREERIPNNERKQIPPIMCYTVCLQTIRSPYQQVCTQTAHSSFVSKCILGDRIH